MYATSRRSGGSCPSCRQVYYFRDQQGLEVDFIVPLVARTVALIEARATRSVRPDDAASLDRLVAAMPRHDVRPFVVSRTTLTGTTALRPSVSAVTVPGLLETLRPRKQ